MIDTKLLQSAINNYGGLEQMIKAAQQQQVIGAKKDILSLDGIAEETSSDSDIGQNVRSGKTNILKKVKSIPAGDNQFMEQAQEYLSGMHNISKVNNPDKINLINGCFGGGFGMFVDENGKKVFDLGNGNTISKNDISKLMEEIVPQAMQQHNELITSAANIAESVMGGTIPWAKIDQTIDTIFNTSANSQDRDPSRIFDQKESFAVDRLGGKPSMADYYKNSKEFQNALSGLKEGASEMFDQLLKPFIRDVYFSPHMAPKVEEQTKQATPEVDFNNLQSVENEISRLQGLSEQEKFNLDYSEGSVEGSISERLAKLQMQKEALSKGKSDLDKTPEWKKIG
jgi:hypothetical protein